MTDPIRRQEAAHLGYYRLAASTHRRRMTPAQVAAGPAGSPCTPTARRGRPCGQGAAGRVFATAGRGRHGRGARRRGGGGRPAPRRRDASPCPTSSTASMDAGAAPDRPVLPGRVGSGTPPVAVIRPVRGLRRASCPTAPGSARPAGSRSPAPRRRPPSTSRSARSTSARSSATSPSSSATWSARPSSPRRRMPRSTATSSRPTSSGRWPSSVSFGGDVEGYSGDGILFRFGWPQAHEDDAAQALTGRARHRGQRGGRLEERDAWHPGRRPQRAGGRRRCWAGPTGGPPWPSARPSTWRPGCRRWPSRARWWPARPPSPWSTSGSTSTPRAAQQLRGIDRAGRGLPGRRDRPGGSGRGSTARDRRSPLIGRVGRSSRCSPAPVGPGPGRHTGRRS